ncbi:PAS domain S-box protein [Paenibacillus thermotolerans]|uniref:sensor histidine kinase n=1 Tax=Paenibacillus thermotolerans TaxID=3027807 RepID=UPI002367BAED|nr:MULTISPECIES: PAS domain S-box protein [unclassified Paenibacillus]
MEFKLAADKEEMFRIIAENTMDAIIVVGNDAVVQYVSPSIKEMIGFTPEQYLGMDAFEVIHPEDRELVRLSHTNAVRTKLPVDIEYRVSHAEGHTLYAEARVKPVLDDDGAVKYVVAVVRDVTKRKQAEQLLEGILENVNAAVMSTDKDFTHLTYASDSLARMARMPKQDIIKKPILMHTYMHPDDDAHLMYDVKSQLDQGISVTTNFRVMVPGEETRWVKLTVSPYLNQYGEIERVDGIMMDETEKKLAEIALEKSEQRYKSLFENNLDGVFSIDLNGYFVNANRAFERITGIQFDKLPDRCFMGLIFDEDQFTVNEALYYVTQRKEPRDVECRIVRPELGERIMHITLVPIFLSGGLIGVHGIVKDITERKREERELIQSEERYKALQQSLNRFSNDLANVMKVSELENRLIDEVKTVLQVSDASIEEVPRGQEHTLTDANQIWIKIGEKQQPVYLRIGMDGHRPFMKVEEEWLETAVHYVTILYDNLHFIEDLMKRLEDTISNNDTPKWMLRLLFQLSEKERASLSSDLHDSVLQDLIIWYRKLESLRSNAAASIDKGLKAELLQIEEGILDAIHQIRITCNELRPPFLLKMGLVESLKSLFSYSRMFANYEIEFSAEQLDIALNEEQILGMYRIVQELLNNASKHSKASKVAMTLEGTDDHIRFSYSDDGVGIDLSAFENSFQHMGIAGIEKRVQSLEGEMALKSAPGQGFHVSIYLPTKTQVKGERYGNFIG